jgi:DNA adenine methylase
MQPFMDGWAVRPVNVASVPQRSPFRYPGGKTWLIPVVRMWLRSVAPVNMLIEPFAGGAVVSLTAVSEGFARRATIVELDEDVGSVWKTILGDGGEWLAGKILSFEMTEASVNRVLRSRPRRVRDRAFSTLLRNRVQRGGILAPGAGLMKLGENGRGLKSRWYPETLRRRILDILGIRSRLRFVEGDGISYIERHAERDKVAFFVDPPYVSAGRRLYRCSDVDHERLFWLVKRVRGDFLLTYDDSAEIRRLITQFRLDCETIPMRNTHNTTMLELLVGRDLKWFRRPLPRRPASGEFFPQKLPERQAHHP